MAISVDLFKDKLEQKNNKGTILKISIIGTNYNCISEASPKVLRGNYKLQVNCRKQ